MSQKLKVILVDDCQSFREAIQFLFEMDENIELLVYANTAEFLNEFPAVTQGILLIDIIMPEMNGLALLEKLQSRNNHFYTIVISAHADNTTAQRAKEIGAHEFLPKPFDVDNLLSKIKKYFKRMNERSALDLPDLPTSN